MQKKTKMQKKLEKYSKFQKYLDRVLEVAEEVTIINYSYQKYSYQICNQKYNSIETHKMCD